MKTFQSTRRVPHSADQMFALVADVERYPEFVPLCTGLSVRTREQAGETGILTANMTVAYKMFSETFTSRVTLDRTERRILVESIDGPFEHLENRWAFRPVERGGCEVEFYIAYAFRSRTLQMMMGTMFDRAFAKFADAFETRADAVYGAKENGARARLGSA